MINLCFMAKGYHCALYSKNHGPAWRPCGDLASLSMNTFFSRLQDFQKALDTGCVIHVYDCKDVNQAVLQPTNPPMKAWLASHGYEKYTLYSQPQLSAYLFIPRGDAAFAPPHSHHSKRALTSTWGLYETSVSLPECIQSQLLPTLYVFSIERNGDWAIVYQSDLHVGTKFPRSDMPNGRLLCRRYKLVAHGLGLMGGCG